MKKLEVSEEFVKEAHRAACSTWKGKIEKEFPELFEGKVELGKWVKDKNGPLICVILDNEFSFSMKGYGVNYAGKWVDKLNLECENWNTFRLATQEEIESMLWKEAEKRGIGKDTKIEKCMYWGKEWADMYYVEFNFKEDRLFNNCGCIYNKGKWATPLNPNKELQEETEKLQKQLDELKLKVK